MTTEPREILLVGGPGHGTTVMVGLNQTTYEMVTDKPGPSFYTPNTSFPAYLGMNKEIHTYRVVFFGAKDTWVGVYENLPVHQQYGMAMTAVTQRDAATAAHHQQQLKAWEAIDALAKLRTEEKAMKDDGLTHITIKTTKPDKWRFFDTETGETWRWDEEKNTFTPVVYT